VGTGEEDGALTTKVTKTTKLHNYSADTVAQDGHSEVDQESIT